MKKQKLLARVRRVQGQIAGIERMLADDEGSFKILQTIAASKGALSGLSAELIESHIESIASPDVKQSDRLKACDELRDIVQAYFR
jgi:DNA-binding FrmR family transcriptional regulator